MLAESNMSKQNIGVEMDIIPHVSIITRNRRVDGLAGKEACDVVSLSLEGIN